MMYLAVVISCFSSCASTKISNIRSLEELELAEDEANLWKVVDEIQLKLDKSGFIYEDPLLAQYLDEVLNKVIGAGFEQKYGVNLKVLVIRDPDFNAFAFPNGAIYLHTGLLASLENEAQLAHVIGHEATHFMNRHVLRQWRSMVNKTAFLKSFEILTSGVAVYGGVGLAGIVGDLSGLGMLGAMAGYSRALEDEADREGFEMTRRAGYDATEAVKAFEILEDSLKDEKRKVPYFYSSHPQAKKRIKLMKKLVEEAGLPLSDEVDSTGEEMDYLNRTKVLMLDNAELDMKRNNFRLARRQIERYFKKASADPRAFFLNGELNRMEWLKPADKKSRNKRESLDVADKNFAAQAESAYLKAIEFDPAYADSYRGLGLLYYKKKELEKAKEQFKKYLDLQPQAGDADYIRGYLGEEKN
jgi:predicted Zn-dependent protease